MVKVVNDFPKIFTLLGIYFHICSYTPLIAVVFFDSGPHSCSVEHTFRGTPNGTHTLFVPFLRFYLLFSQLLFALFAMFYYDSSTVFARPLFKFRSVIEFWRERVLRVVLDFWVFLIASIL